MACIRGPKFLTSSREQIHQNVDSHEKASQRIHRTYIRYGAYTCMCLHIVCECVLWGFYMCLKSNKQNMHMNARHYSAQIMHMGVR